MTGYDFHPEAESDIDEIWVYIAADNVTAADRIIADFHQGLEGLVPFPHRGHRRPDLTGRSSRFIRVRDYLIAYAPDRTPLWVMQSIFSSAARRAILTVRQNAERRGGELKMDWTEPPGCTGGYGF